jgi:histidinol-phosphate aminotransferase
MDNTRRRLVFGMGMGIGIGVGRGAAAATPSFATGYLDFASHPPSDKEVDRPIRLDRNENPYGPSPLAIAAMRDGLDSVNRYPNSSKPLREKIAGHHRVKPEQILLGCGSSEILKITADAFLKPGKKLVIATPSFPLLSFYAQNNGVEVVEVPLAGNRSHDLEAMLAKADASTGLVYICNPNNPTGTVTARTAIDEFLRRLPPAIPVVIDEAYHEYVTPSASYASFIDRPAGDGRTIVARTFSKIHALAGVRVGYAVASQEMAEKLWPFSLQFAVNSLAIQAAMAALDDTAHVRQSVQRNNDQRQEFFNHANVRMAGVSDSQTNFVLLQVDHPIEEVLTHFRKNNVLLGPRFPGVDGFVRVSIGRPADMKEFWRVWDMLPHQDMHK